jgi:aminoglycoside 6'-N-acetyltransferase I
MKILPLEEADLPGCAALFVEVFSAPPWNESWDTSTVLRRFDDFWRTPGFFGRLARSEEQIVGFALGQVEHWDVGRHFHLQEMCVALEMQRRGAGSQLMDALEDHLRETGVGRIMLHTARESDAQAFYDRCGFHTSARMVMMSKRLTPNG